MKKIKNILNNKVYVVLVLVVFTAAFLRFYKLNQIPVSLYWDEVAIGYNAHSIASTGKDEYGKFMPLLFESYNDYKMPVNVYLSAISTKLFGLNEFTVRLPSAFLGTLTVFFTFLFVRLLFSISKKRERIDPEKIAILSAFLLAISPWHIQFSRGGFEANIALFFSITAFYLLFKSFENNKLFLLSCLSFVMAFYSYRSIYLFLPLLILGAFFIWRKRFKNIGIKNLFFGLSASIILLIPITHSLMTEGSTRFNQTSITNKVNEKSMELFNNGVDVNRKFLYGQVFAENYLSSFSPAFLFTQGDPNGRHSPRGMGVLYLYDFLFILVGFFVLIRKISRKVGLFILIWLIVFPISAALSIPVPHSLRTINLLPLPQVLTAIGMLYLVTLIPQRFAKLYFGVLSILILSFFIKYINLYQISNTQLSVSDWGDGYKQLINYTNSLDAKYDKIIISGYYWQPYMYTLFYTEYDPKSYQNVGTSERFGKYIFGGTSWDQDVIRDALDQVDLRILAGKNSTLVALAPVEFKKQKENISVKNRIYDHTGKVVFIVGEVK